MNLSEILDEAIKRVVDALNHLVVDEVDIKRKINSAIATLVLNYEDVESVNNMLQNYLVYYHRIIPDLKDIYESITVDDIKRVVGQISTENISIVTMKKEEY